MDNMIIDVPLEPLEQRYTIEWRKWFLEYMKPNHRIDGELLTDKVVDGTFLDVCGTNYFKASQLQQIAKFIYEFRNDNQMRNFVFFFHDIWFPGIEALAYMRDGLNLKFKIAGCLHAGSYDKHDFVTYQGMGHWGKHIENGWFRLIDHIFVATEWHKRQLIHSRDVEPNRVHVTGFPIYYEDDELFLSPLDRRKKDQVVLPNRLTIDKNPQLFEFVRDNRYFCPALRNWEFVTTFSETGFLSKEDYWKTLKESKIMISFADHENWGIAVQEALFAGCFVVLPNKLSYVELYNPIVRYSCAMDLFQILEKVVDACNYGGELLTLRVRDRDYALKRGREAIPNMLEIINS